MRVVVDSWTLTERLAIRKFIKYERAWEHGQRRKITLPPARRERAYGPEGTVNPEPLNGYYALKGLPDKVY